MSESTLDFEPGEAAESSEPVRSGWKRAVVVFTALGAASYIFGRLVQPEASGQIPPQVMIMATMLGPLVALIGFGLWWCFLGDGGRWKRVLSVLGVLAAIAVVVVAGESWMRLFVAVWGVPLAAGITGLALVVHTLFPLAPGRMMGGRGFCSFCLRRVNEKSFLQRTDDRGDW